MVSVPLGVIAAVFRGRLLDRIALAIALVGQAVPSFWTGLIAIDIFAVLLRWLPTSGIGGWQHLVLPSVTTAWFITAGLVRLLRSSMLEALGSEYITVARAKGLSEGAVILRHALPNALIPVLTYLGMMWGLIVGAAITTEVVFAWPGLGRLTYEAMLTRDFPLLQFAVLTWTFLVLVINFVVDLAYVAIDPRIKL
jgi:peptide/nickel transport system permease protein